MDRKDRYKQLLEEIKFPRELSELVEEVDIEKSTVRKYLGELVDKGRAKRVKKGFYRRTQEGSDWLPRQEGTDQVQEVETVSNNIDWDRFAPYSYLYNDPAPLISFSPTEWMEENPGKLEMLAAFGFAETGVHFLNKEEFPSGVVFTGLGLVTGIDGFFRMLKNRSEDEPSTQERERKELEILEEEDPL